MKHHMKKTILIILLMFPAMMVLAQETKISGTIKDADSGDPVIGANIAVKGKVVGTISDEKGNFSLKLSQAPPVTLIISEVGFDNQVITVTEPNPSLNISLNTSTHVMNELVVAPTRVEENILQSPVSIEKMDAEQIRETASMNYYDALHNLKGVDMVTSAITFKPINTRGFNDTGNPRFLQLVDGMDNQTPGLNFAVGNLFGASDLDVESVELIPGAASALYGPVAFNGVLMINTKDPFEYQGLSVELKTGINHIGESYANPHGLFDYSVRYAKAFNNKFAFKVNASYLKALDWYATNYTDVDQNTPPDERGPDNPARDALNIYGDEVTVNLPGIGWVSRTGYEERQLMQYDVHSLKLNGSLNYRINDNMEASYQYSFGNGTAPYTGSNRFCLNDFILQQHKVEIKGSNYFLRAYGIIENSQDSYNARALGQQIDRTWVRDLNGNVVSPDQADATWFNRYAEAFNGNISSVTSGDHMAARDFADLGRILPGSADFEAKKDSLIHTYGLSGAGVFSNSKFYHIEGQYDLSNEIKFVDLLVGGNFRLYDMFTNGTLFDDKDNRIRVKEGGLFIQASKSLLDDRLKLVLSDRYDKNQNFKGRMTPRASAVLNVTGNQHFRVSYQSGFRNPTVGDQYIKLNAGVITILGGVPDNSKDLNVYQNSFRINSVGAFGSAFGQAVGSGTPPDQAVMNNKDLLQKSDVDYIKPEQVKSFEIGYKTLVGNKFYVDLNYYYSTYTNFILNTVVMEPDSPVLDGEGNINPQAAFDILNNNVHLYQLYTNASDRVSTQGGTLGVMYRLPGGYTISANGTLATLDLKNANPDNIPPFNTPRYRTNVMFGNSTIDHKWGFNVAWRWQDAFDWYGTFNQLRPGTIDAHSIFDAQVSYKISSLKTIVKLGACNLFNNQVYEAYGSPTIGGIYYVSLLFDQFLN